MPSRIVCTAAGGMTESRNILTLILKAAQPARYTAAYAALKLIFPFHLIPPQAFSVPLLPVPYL